MIAALIAGLVAGYGIAMPVGAVATYLVALTARSSLKVGVFAALGVASADGLYALVAAFGGAALAPLIQPITLPLRWGAALVLAALAIKGAAAAISRYRARRTAARRDETAMSPSRAYLVLLGITMMNPITVIYFAALVLGGGQTSAATPGYMERLVFILAAFGASASWQLLLAGGGALLGRVLTGSRGRLLTALASSSVIGALALHLILAVR